VQITNVEPGLYIKEGNDTELEIRGCTTLGLVHLIPQRQGLAWIEARSWFPSPAMYFFQIDKFVVFVYSKTGISAQLIPTISTETLWKKFFSADFHFAQRQSELREGFTQQG
jgi:hypothetical protein